MTTEIKLIELWLNKFFSATSPYYGEKIVIKEQIGRINNLKVEMYSNDHNPPHFHVTSKDGRIDASFRLDNCELIEGKVSSSDKKLIKEFHKHKGHLLLDYYEKKVMKSDYSKQ